MENSCSSFSIAASLSLAKSIIHAVFVSPALVPREVMYPGSEAFSETFFLLAILSANLHVNQVSILGSAPKSPIKSTTSSSLSLSNTAKLFMPFLRGAVITISVVPLGFSMGSAFFGYSTRVHHKSSGCLMYIQICPMNGSVFDRFLIIALYRIVAPSNGTSNASSPPIIVAASNSFITSPLELSISTLKSSISASLP